MKKIVFTLFGLFLISGISNLSFAQTSQALPPAVVKKDIVKTEVIKGKIISIDMKNNLIVVKEGKANINKTITVDPKVIASLKVDENVKVSVKKGSNLATSVKEVYKKTKSAKK